MAETLLDATSTYPFTIDVTSLYFNIAGREDTFVGTRLLQATHYKNKDAIAHEFLILRLFDGRYVIPLRVERRPSKRKVQGDPSGASWAAVSVADDSVSRELKYDEKQYLEDYFKISDVRCPARPFVTLHDVCDILYSVHKDYPNYHLIQYQCYWFCSMFLRKLEKTPQLKKIVHLKGRNHNRKGVFYKFMKMPIMTTETVDRDIDEALERETVQQQEAKKTEEGRIRDGIRGILELDEAKKAVLMNHSRQAVTPLLGSSDTRNAREIDAIRGEIGRMWAYKAQKSDEEQVHSTEHSFLSEFLSQLGSSSTRSEC